MKPVIAVKELSFGYPGASRPALDGVSFQVRPGEFLGITGPAGAGKSTLVLCLNGIIPHFQAGAFRGQVLINGADTFEAGCSAISKQVGSVFQDPEAQLVAPTVEDEIAFGLENFGYPPAEIESRIEEALRLTGIAPLRQRSTQALSGGQKQRVAIAAAVALRPEILVLDEPTSELDPIGTMEVFEVLKLLNQQYGLTIVVIEQKLNILMEYIGRLLIFTQGELVCDRPPREVIAEPALLKAIGLNLPPVSDLAYRLREDGRYTAELPLTVDEAYWGLLKSLAGAGDK
jgi:energy-coupling factor transport system ATP-binding protein